MSDISEATLIFIITSGIGFLLAIVRACYKSKCDEVDFCCIKIIRNTQVERTLDERIPMERQQSNVSL